MKIKKGDNVIVLTGKDKGKKGKVVRSLPSMAQVIVEGINLRKKTKKGGQGKGSIIELEYPMSISNIAIVDPKSDKPTRIGFSIKDGKKSRITKKSKSVLD